MEGASNSNLPCRVLDCNNLVHDLFSIVMLHLVGFDAQLHAILVKGLLSKLDILGFDLGRLTGASGPTQSLVMRHQLLNGCSVFRHQSVAAVKSGKEGGGKK